MLQRAPKSPARKIRSSRYRRPQTIAPVIRLAAAPLALPAVQVRPVFVHESKPTAELKTVATAMVEGGWLTAEMYQAHKGDLAACIAEAVAGIARTARPKPLAKLNVVIADSPERAEIGYNNSNEEYNSRKGCAAGKVSALVVHGATDEPIHRVIGPKIQSLEKIHPGLGQTVLYWLHAALDKSARSCNPISGLGWASTNYWMGEADEEWNLKEELDSARDWHEQRQKELPAAERKPFDEAAAKVEIGMFTRKDYDAKIPTWASGARPRVPLSQLRRLLRPTKPKTLMEVMTQVEPDLVDAVVQAATLTKAMPHCCLTHDLGCFEQMRWEICPFLLRWERGLPDPQKSNGDWVQDHLGMIWDDFMNREFEAGETNMSAIAAWGWHDGPSLINALRRFEKWCQLLQSAETLLNLIQPEDLD